MSLKTVSTKPPLKRRRLLRSTTSSPSPTTAPKSSITTNATSAKVVSPICTSCHRAVRLTTGAGSIIQCALCSSATCTVCSRTCTHSMTSQPPTPHLACTPTPPLAPSLRRSVLALNSPNTNISFRAADQTPLPPTQISVAGKRRKIVDGDEYDSDLSHLKDILSGDDGVDRQDQDQPPDDLGVGCGRLVCRRCCYEDISNNTMTCLECYGSGT